MYDRLDDGRHSNGEIPLFNDNCFDVIRLIAAVIVMFSHSFKWFGFEKPVCMLFFTDGSVGVIMLYALSGYLTYASYDRIIKKGGNVWLFWYKRIVRIYPLYLLISAFMVGIDVIRGLDILNLTYIIRRFLHIVTFGLIYVPDGITNGVIWSLRVEIIFYFLLPFIYTLLHRKNLAWWIFAVVLLWQFNVWDSQFLAVLSKMPVISLLARADNPAMFIYEFVIGSMFYCHREKLLGFFSKKNVIVPIMILFTVWTFLYDKCGIIEKSGVMHNAVYGLVIPFITIGMGYSFGRLRLNFDISYGLFLVHMLVIYELLRITNGGIFWLVASWIIIVAISFIIHYGFEKPIKHITSHMEKILENKFEK